MSLRPRAPADRVAPRRGAAIPRLADFRRVLTEKVRYSDTDRQGHVNNVTFAVFFEAARVDLLFGSATKLSAPGTEFVLARLYMDLLGQLHWPGQVLIGTQVQAVGRSSINLYQALFQDGACAAVCDAVMVMIRTRSGSSCPLSARARAFLNAQKS